MSSQNNAEILKLVISYGEKHNMGQQIGCKMATKPLPLAVTSCDNKPLICAILMVRLQG